MPTLKTKVTTPHLSSTQAFYETVLGMVVVEAWHEPDDRGVILGFEDSHNEALLEIYDGSSVKDFSGLSLQFKVESIEDFVMKVPDSVPFDGPTQRPWGSTYVYLEDPNQIQVIVYEGAW